MSFDNGPKIITNGLQLMFDAADRNSYPGSGTTWRDLATNRTATLTGLGFSSDNGGAITNTDPFYGNNNRVNVNSPDTTSFGDCTIQSFFMYEGNQSEGAGLLKIVDAGLTRDVDLDNGFAGGRNIAMRDTNAAATWGSELPNNTWHFASGTRTVSTRTLTISVNGLTRVTFTFGSGGTAFTPSDFYMFTRFPTSSAALRGRISVILLYNRVLSVAEELQNYNAIKSRFGL